MIYRLTQANPSIKKFFPSNRMLILLVLVIVLDQTSKWLIMHYHPQWIVINTQGTWGILPWWIGSVGLVGLLIFMSTQQKVSGIFWLILGAGLSNMLDRYWYEGVVDFIHIFSFPVFNLADSLISLGVGYLVWLEVRKHPKE